MKKYKTNIIILILISVLIMYLIMKDDFNNIIKVYIENNSLVLVYNKKDLNDLFFENNYINELKIKYLK